MEIKALANKIVQEHGTRNPFRIAADLDYIIIETPLQGIRGYYQNVYGCDVIYLDNNLTEQERSWVCAHELGHSLLHKDLNRVFMDTHTRLVTSRYELESDKFAVDLLFADEDLADLLGHSTFTVASCLGVSHDLAEYRMSSVKAPEASE